MTDRPTCKDGGTCHHDCRPGECFRVRSCLPLSSSGLPDDWGTPKWWARLDCLRVVDIQTEGPFDTREQAAAALRSMRKGLDQLGADMAYVKGCTYRL